VVTDPRDPGVALPDSREMAVLAARTAASKQGHAAVILDVRELITITDYFVIVSGASDRQVKTLADEVVRALKEAGVRPVRREGEVAARWVLLDFVDFVVHVFNQEEREFYRLENLWRDAPVVDWEQDARATGV
jgi:ribosome-associated protein